MKQYHYRPGQALWVPGGWGSQISRQSAHEGGKVVSPTHRPPLPPGNTPGPGLSQPQGYSAAERLCQWKIPMTPSGIEPATFQLVAQCLNQPCHCVPQSYRVHHKYIDLMLCPVYLYIPLNKYGTCQVIQRYQMQLYVHSYINVINLSTFQSNPLAKWQTPHMYVAKLELCVYLSDTTIRWKMYVYLLHKINYMFRSYFHWPSSDW